MAQGVRTVEDDASHATNRLAWRRCTPATRLAGAAARFAELTLLCILAPERNCTRECV